MGGGGGLMLVGVFAFFPSVFDDGFKYIIAQLEHATVHDVKC